MATEVVYGRKCILQDITCAVEGLVQKAQIAEVFTDDDPYLQLFCATMEALFLYGFQGVPEGLFGTPSGYDKYIKHLPTFYPDASTAISAVWAISKIKTSFGRGRAFVKFALIEKKLDLYLLALVHNESHTRSFYMDGAILLTPEDSSEVIKHVFKLRAVNFSLYLKDSDTSLENERANLSSLGVRTGKLIKTDADMIMSECSWCFSRTVHGLVSEDMQQLYRCQECQLLTMVCVNHCGAMARCLPQRRLLEATCAMCSGDIHGWKPSAQKAVVNESKSKVASSLPTNNGPPKKSKPRPKPTATVAIMETPTSPIPVKKDSSFIDIKLPTVLQESKPDSLSEFTNSIKSEIEKINGASSLPQVAIPLVETPPVEALAVETPPVEILPVKAPPVETLPVKAPPVELPPVKAMPSATTTTTTTTETVETAKPQAAISSENVNPPVALPARRRLSFGDSESAPLESSTDSLVKSNQPPQRIFEGMFQIEDKDDDETAQIKRKILQRIQQKSESAAASGVAALQLEVIEPAARVLSSPPSPTHLTTSPLGSLLNVGSRTSDVSPSKNPFRTSLGNGEAPSTNGSLSSSAVNGDIVVTRKHWMPDDKADVCFIDGCGEAFTIFNRRHHCRRCGDVVCDKHSRKTMRLNMFAVPDPKGVESRVCDECYNSHHTKMLTSDPINDPVPMVVAASNTKTEDSESDRDRSTSLQSLDKKAKPPANWTSPVFDRVPFNVPVKPRKVPELCGACATPLPKGFLVSVRYCEALGIYCCSQCHNGGKIVVPAQVLHNWNFTPMEVCDRMREFLTSLTEEPLYNIDTINPALYKTVPKLRTMKGLREQLGHLQSFLLTCTASKPEKLGRLMPMITVFDPVRYSLRELSELNEGTLIDYITSVNKDFIRHVFECELCKAKGFICEICKDPHPFYSFQTQVSQQCPFCKAFFHAECRKLQADCPRCVRRRKYETK